MEGTRIDTTFAMTILHGYGPILNKPVNLDNSSCKEMVYPLPVSCCLYCYHTKEKKGAKKVKLSL
jgi:hypothetical protein